MQKIYKWDAVTASKRNIVIDNINSAIFSARGAIINFQQFSDIDLGLNIEIEDRKVDSLLLDLNSIISLERNEVGMKQVNVLLNVSFARGTGNMRSEIPNVSG